MTRAWSQKDPHVVVNGAGCTIQVSAWAESPNHDFANFIQGPVDLLVTVPTASTRSYTVPDNGWGTGYYIHFAEDSSMHTGTDGHGVFSQITVNATVPAHLDTDGSEWNMKLELIPDNSDRPQNSQTFRSNLTSSAVLVRV